MKKLSIAMIAFAFLPFISIAQSEEKELAEQKELKEQHEKKEKVEKKETQEIIIRKNGDKDIKLKVEIDGDNVTINGKPMSEYKDDDVIINKRKMIITDGNGPMVWNFNSDGKDWEKWGEEFGERFGQQFGRGFGGDWEMEHEGSGALLGVTTEKDKDGAKITDITKGSAAEKAGLQKGDIITKVDDEKIENPDMLADVIGFKKPKDEVKVTYKRNGKQSTAKATLGKRKNVKAFAYGGPGSHGYSFSMPEPPMAIAPNMEGLHEDMEELHNNMSFAFASRKKIGLKIQDLEEGDGVKVINVEDSSAAATAGIKKDDIITEINGKKIKNTDDAREELVPDEDKKVYKIRVNRSGSEMSFDVKIPRKLKTANL